MKQVFSHDEFRDQAKDFAKSFLLLYKPTAASGDCALTSLQGITDLENESFSIFYADVTTVRDIHPNYGITSVPSLLIFEKGQFVNVIKGCNDKDFYRSIAESAIVQLNTSADDKPARSVTVYTTPTCTWCNTLKAFLRKHQIHFTEVDVSRDAEAARQMTARSGQQGVPQTDINGTIVVGFDQPKLKRLLEI